MYHTWLSPKPWSYSSTMPKDLCHHPSQGRKGVWEQVTFFAYMESGCKLFRNCDPGRVLFVESKQTCWAVWGNIHAFSSLAVVSLCRGVGWATEITLFLSNPLGECPCIGLDQALPSSSSSALGSCSIRHWQQLLSSDFQLSFCAFPLQQTLPGRKGEKADHLQNVAFCCPEPRKHLYTLPPSSQPTLNSPSFAQGHHEWWGKRTFPIPTRLSHLSWEKALSIYIILKAMLIPKDLRYP